MLYVTRKVIITENHYKLQIVPYTKKCLYYYNAIDIIVLSCQHIVSVIYRNYICTLIILNIMRTNLLKLLYIHIYIYSMYKNDAF
jgi:hypothetical protein